MEHTGEERRLIEFFDNMAEGKIPYNSKMYVVDDYTPPCTESDVDQQGAAALKLVTPTQQQVEQAKVQLKRNVIARLPATKQRKVKKRSFKKRRQSIKKVKRRKPGKVAKKRRVQKGSKKTKVRRKLRW